MTYTVKRLIEGSLLTAAAATYYTAPSATTGASPPPTYNTKTIITKLTFTNVDTASHLVTAYLVPAGGAFGNTNIVWDQKLILGLQTLDCFEAEGHVLEPGDFLQASADVANQVNIVGSGVEVA